MIFFFLGTIYGSILAILVFLVATRFETPIKRTINQIRSKTKRHGAILGPENEALDTWIESLPEK